MLKFAGLIILVVVLKLVVAWALLMYGGIHLSMEMDVALLALIIVLVGWAAY